MQSGNAFHYLSTASNSFFLFGDCGVFTDMDNAAGGQKARNRDSDDGHADQLSAPTKDDKGRRHCGMEERRLSAPSGDDRAVFRTDKERCFQPSGSQAFQLWTYQAG